MRHKTTVSIEVEIEIEVEYSPSQPGRFYMANGDPGYPDEPAMWELTKTDRFIVDVDDQIRQQMGDDKWYNQVMEQIEEELTEVEIAQQEQRNEAREEGMA